MLPAKRHLLEIFTTLYKPSVYLFSGVTNKKHTLVQAWLLFQPRFSSFFRKSKGTSIHWNYKLFNYILEEKSDALLHNNGFFKDVFFATTIYFRPAVNRFLNSKERYWSGNTLELVFSVGSALGDCNSQAVSWRVGGLLVIQVFSTCTRLKVSRNVHPSQREKMIW